MSEDERRVIAAELPGVIRRLRSCASSDGAISRTVFEREAERLGLGTEEQRRRLRTGLAGVGLRVKVRPRAMDVRERPSAVSAAARVSAMPPSEAARRLAQARTMLGRYADADGRVGKLAHDGVVRLHGLGPAEARELSAHFPTTRPRPVDASARRDRAVGSGAKSPDTARGKGRGGPVMSARVFLVQEVRPQPDHERRDTGIGVPPLARQPAECAPGGRVDDSGLRLVRGVGATPDRLGPVARPCGQRAEERVVPLGGRVGVGCAELGAESVRKRSYDVGLGAQDGLLGGFQEGVRRDGPAGSTGLLHQHALPTL
ncbi:hypothetical protein [Streptomyces sp. SM11]|uniref:hypothetical protein n=1 Tax=Streptomyces sp. SM11 TaxID=565557 RepID=UPI0011B039A0|nr:hypothetical protein [Streptomyces sp. SM11]